MPITAAFWAQKEDKVRCGLFRKRSDNMMEISEFYDRQIKRGGSVANNRASRKRKRASNRKTGTRSRRQSGGEVSDPVYKTREQKGEGSKKHARHATQKRRKFSMPGERETFKST